MTPKSVEERIEHLEAIYEIQNQMGSYSWHRGEQSDLFAKRDDVSLCIGPWGIYKGQDGSRRFFSREIWSLPKKEDQTQSASCLSTTCARLLLKWPKMEKRREVYGCHRVLIACGIRYATPVLELPDTTGIY